MNVKLLIEELNQANETIELLEDQIINYEKEVQDLIDKMRQMEYNQRHDLKIRYGYATQSANTYPMQSGVVTSLGMALDNNSVGALSSFDQASAAIQQASAQMQSAMQDSILYGQGLMNISPAGRLEAITEALEEERLTSDEARLLLDFTE